MSRPPVSTNTKNAVSEHDWVNGNSGARTGDGIGGLLGALGFGDNGVDASSTTASTGQAAPAARQATATAAPSRTAQSRAVSRMSNAKLAKMRIRCKDVLSGGGGYDASLVELCGMVSATR